jgi:hypothetical protein
VPKRVLGKLFCGASLPTSSLRETTRPARQRASTHVQQLQQEICLFVKCMLFKYLSHRSLNLPSTL